MKISNPFSLWACCFLVISLIFTMIAVLTYTLSREFILLISLIALLVALIATAKGEHGVLHKIGLWGSAAFFIFLVLYAFIPFWFI